MLNFKIVSLIAILFLGITVAIFVNRSSPPAPNPTYDKSFLDAESKRISSATPPGTRTPIQMPGNPPAPNSTYDKSALDAEIDRIRAPKPLGTYTPTNHLPGNGRTQEK